MALVYSSRDVYCKGPEIHCNSLCNILHFGNVNRLEPIMLIKVYAEYSILLFPVFSPIVPVNLLLIPTNI